jgi:hypothetical protein
MRKKGNAYRALVGKPKGKRPLGRRRWEDNIKMDLRVIAWDDISWIDLAEDGDQWRAIVNMVIKTSENFLVAAQLAASQEGLSSMELE